MEIITWWESTRHRTKQRETPFPWPVWCDNYRGSHIFMGRTNARRRRLRNTITRKLSPSLTPALYSRHRYCVIPAFMEKISEGNTAGSFGSTIFIPHEGKGFDFLRCDYWYAPGRDGVENATAGNSVSSRAKAKP